MLALFVPGKMIRSSPSAPELCSVLSCIAPFRRLFERLCVCVRGRYVRALGAFYLRLVGKSVEIYTYLEPLYNDYRKLNIRTLAGGWEQTTMDAFVEQLLTSEMVCDIAMPFLQKRLLLERAGSLTVRCLVCLF